MIWIFEAYNISYITTVVIMNRDEMSFTKVIINAGALRWFITMIALTVVVMWFNQKYIL